MDELIGRALSGEINPSDAERLRDWRLGSPENERCYQEFVRLWELEVPGAPDGEPASRPSVAAIIDAAERRRAMMRPLRQPSAPRAERRWGRRAGVAAALAAALLLGVALPDLLNRAARGGVAATEVLMAGGGAATFALSDGSVVRLAPNSRITLATGGEERSVHLDGRAFFSVTSDSLNPFTIRTDAGEAVVLGTRFEIASEGQDLRLVVLDGRVGLSASGSRVEVGADEVSYVVDGAAPTLERVSDARALLDWPNGLLVFRGTPMSEVAREIERTFGVRFGSMDPALGRRTVSGWFADESIDEVLAAVCRATDSRCTLDGRQVIVTDRNR